MTQLRARPRPPAPTPTEPLPSGLDRRFEAVVFDWDGTAVPDRRSEAGGVRDLVQELTKLGMHLLVVSGTHVDNVDGQLQARACGPGRLYLCLNRGSEVFRVGTNGPRVVHRRVATSQEEAALDAAADLAVRRLSDRGLDARIVSSRLNRRKIDLIPAWSYPLKAQIAELLAAVEARLERAGIGGLPEAVAIALGAAADAGLPNGRVTSDVKHVEIGLTDKSDSAGWAFEELWRLGIGPDQVVIVGDEFGPLGGVAGSDSFLLADSGARATALSVGVEPTGVPEGVILMPGGPESFLRLMKDQARRRRRGEPPEPAGKPEWRLAVEGVDPEQEPLREARMTLADGVIGTRGTALGTPRGRVPGVLAGGVYRGEGPETDLLTGPAWAWAPKGRSGRRVLDLHSGTLHEWIDSKRSTRFSSLARPALSVLRGERVGNGGAPLLRGGREVETGPGPRDGWIRVRGNGGGLAAAALEVDQEGSTDRLAAYAGSSRRLPSVRPVVARVKRARDAGFERLLVEHREAWARRWEEGGITLDGDPELQLAVRFAQFHLMASVSDRGEAAVGARGLTGPAYRGHVFWDADVFVLPFLAATHPASARAMLEYRARRLPYARAAAHRLGRGGARFPWESAGSGDDVTPGVGRDRTGRAFPIRTGLLEEHIVADVAWAAACYMDWTGDEEFRQGPGGLLLAETARYWASRIRLDEDGRAHLYGVIGPDEYHEPVDDNAFTNVMARWNLRRAAHDADRQADEQERRRWLRLSNRLLDGYDEATGLYEQFAGFFELEPLVIAELARRPVAADLLLGADRAEQAQVVKQADVLMLHHMVPDEVAPGSLSPNLNYYEPRTAHGSSLSPGVHAALFARAGRLEEAVAALRTAALLDLDDLTGTTAGGLHLGTMGSVWQALAFGFVGAQPRGGVLHLDPTLPNSWRALEVPLLFRGASVRVRIEGDGMRVRTDRPVKASLAGASPVTILPPGRQFRRSDGVWKEERT